MAYPRFARRAIARDATGSISGFVAAVAADRQSLALVVGCEAPRRTPVGMGAVLSVDHFGPANATHRLEIEHPHEVVFIRLGHGNRSRTG